MAALGAAPPRSRLAAPGWRATAGVNAVYHRGQARSAGASTVSNVTSIRPARRAVDWYSTTEGATPAPEEPRLPSDKVSLSPEAREALDPEERREVERLRERDAHVRAHEAAHQAAGGELTGPASFTYRLGPDGRSYAVGGEVPVLGRSGRTPDETIAMARRVRAAALAPSDPSAADLAAAAAASQVEAQAAEQQRALRRGEAGPASAPQRADLERLVVRAPEPEPFM